MVQLKESPTNKNNDNIIISIPNGSIKSIVLSCIDCVIYTISIPNGSIKRLNVVSIIINTCSFQFQMVQLKGCAFLSWHTVFGISIPNGSIKRRMAFWVLSSNDSISIPNGSIKSPLSKTDCRGCQQFQFQMVQLKDARNVLGRASVSNFNSKWFN